MRNNQAEIEWHEIINKLVLAGHKDLVDAILLNQKETFTSTNRLNKSGLSRVMGLKVHKIEKMFEECRKLIEEDVDWEYSKTKE